MVFVRVEVRDVGRLLYCICAIDVNRGGEKCEEPADVYNCAHLCFELDVWAIIIMLQF